MATFRRATQGTTYFFTVVSYQRRGILCDERIRRALRQAVLTVRERYPFTIDAWVLLPDHLHTIWTLPAEDNNYSRRWGLIKRYVSKDCGQYYPADNHNLSRIKKKETAIWQRRFWEHMIRDEQDYERCFHYIHYNPIKHGLVTNLSDWRYSTYHRYVQRGIYPPDWSIEESYFGNDSYGE